MRNLSYKIQLTGNKMDLVLSKNILYNLKDFQWEVFSQKNKVFVKKKLVQVLFFKANNNIVTKYDCTS